MIDQHTLFEFRNDLDSIQAVMLMASSLPYHGYLSIAGVGLVLGILGGGGSILALPAFMFGFHHSTDVAMSESLAVVSVGSAVAFASHLRSGTVDLPIALPFAALAMAGSFFSAGATDLVPEQARMAIFAAIAITSSAVMLRSALHDLHSHDVQTDSATATEAGFEDSRMNIGVEAPQISPSQRALALTNLTGRSTDETAAADCSRRRFGPALAGQALGVGVLTALTGAGGGFLVVPALTSFAGLPVSAVTTMRCRSKPSRPPSLRTAP